MTDWYDRAPVKKESLTDEQVNKIANSKHFCMLPWVHMHSYPDGRVYPCCMGDYWHPLGNLREASMKEVWNQKGYKSLRKAMLNDEPSKVCEKCYEQESLGLFSMRNDSNRQYGHHYPIVEETNADGSLDDFKIRYWDIRFSNLCNMKCRTCGPVFSSQWYRDHVKLYNRKPDADGRELSVIEYTAGSEESMIAQMEEHIPYLEQVYFAGGEPLIMKEHYYLLEKLIEYGKTDVRIFYNTNFSELSYKDKHVFEYWKHFKTVGVGASLDASGKRGELMRKGTDWTQTVKNRECMIEEVPHVDFYVSATVGALNSYHVTDFHREWVDFGLISPQDWNINLCQSPEWYRPDALPLNFRKEVLIPRIEKHIEWLEPLDHLTRATQGYKGLINILNNESEVQWERFIKETKLLDDLREESFWDVFPEYSELKP